MSTKTDIEWTDVSWNPVRGCALVSAGCANCYAMKQAHRFSGSGKPYEGLTELGPQGPRWTGKITLVPELLEEPLRWQKPRRVFVNSMSDLFHEDVPDEFIANVFWAMALSPMHTFQILTKRPERMRQWVNDPACRAAVIEAEGDADWIATEWKFACPLPNVWLGVSVEDQKMADERIPLLLQTPAAVRWISAEPLLGPVDIARYLGVQRMTLPARLERGLDWVVVGMESGPGARPGDVAWIRSIVRQCRAAGVPVFVKQLGAVPIMAKIDWQTMTPTPVLSARNDIVCPDFYVPLHLNDKKGGDPAEWPEDLRVREWP